MIKSSAFALILIGAGWIVLGAAEGDEAGTSPVKVDLVEVRETRKAILTSGTGEEASFDFSPPGIELRFALTPPAGKQVIEVEQPQRLVARDSTGFDLTKIEKNVFGRREFIKLIQPWNEPAREITLTLTNARRHADRFSVNAAFDLWAFDSIETLMFEVTTTAGVQKHPLLPHDVSVRLEDGGNGVHLVVRPGTTKPYLEKVELSDGKTAYNSVGTMWNESAMTYMFTGSFKPKLWATFSVRKGMEKFPCRVVVNDHLLP